VQKEKSQGNKLVKPVLVIISIFLTIVFFFSIILYMCYFIYGGSVTSLALIEFFLSRGIHVDREYHGITPLWVAARTGRYDVAEFLIRKGADVNFSDMRSETPLHLAARNGNMKLVQLLISKGADMDVKNIHGQTPLSIASEYHCTEVAALLKRHGAGQR